MPFLVHETERRATALGSDGGIRTHVSTTDVSPAPLEPSLPAATSSPPPLGLAGFLRRCIDYLRPYRVQATLILVGLSLELAFYVSLPLRFRFLIDRAISLATAGS
jgi:hypothetical protein